MTPFLIHIGVDECYRVPVLKEAGFLVAECPSVRRLKCALVQLPEPDAVALAESGEIDEKAVSLVQSSCTAPLILFQGRDRCVETAGFDLVVQPLTDPRVWLKDLACVIERSRVLRSQAPVICPPATLLRSQIAEAVDKPRRERLRPASLSDRSPLADPYKDARTRWAGR